jgi:hypothetical protein
MKRRGSDEVNIEPENPAAKVPTENKAIDSTENISKLGDNKDNEGKLEATQEHKKKENTKKKSWMMWLGILYNLPAENGFHFTACRRACCSQYWKTVLGLW